MVELAGVGGLDECFIAERRWSVLVVVIVVVAGWWCVTASSELLIDTNRKSPLYACGGAIP